VRSLLVLAALAASAKPTPRVVVVTIHDMRFDPASVTLERGDRLRFDNHDLVGHTATVPGVFDSGRIEPGKTSKLSLPAAAGEYHYGCTLHPSMTGAVTVR
jgi:plastocyanin